MNKVKEKRFSRELAIDQLKADLISELPPNAQVSNVVFEGPFLKEERNLLNTIAKQLGIYTERSQVVAELIREREVFVDPDKTTFFILEKNTVRTVINQCV